MVGAKINPDETWAEYLRRTSRYARRLCAGYNFKPLVVRFLEMIYKRACTLSKASSLREESVCGFEGAGGKWKEPLSDSSFSPHSCHVLE